MFMAERGCSRIKSPVWNGKTISLFKIFQSVQNCGGYNEVLVYKYFEYPRRIYDVIITRMHARVIHGHYAEARARNGLEHRLGQRLQSPLGIFRSAP